jgi:hypothetical protein
MNILRQPPYTTFAEYELEADTDYQVIIRDFDRYEVIYQDTITSDEDGFLYIPWTDEVQGVDFSKYDEVYSLEIIEDGDLFPIVEDTLTVQRPYISPATLTDGTYTLAQAKKDEALVRAIIDSITGGFYFKSGWLEVEGENTDFMPVWDRTYRVLKAYQNNVLVYDIEQTPAALDGYNYLIIKEKSAIIKDPTYNAGEFSRASQSPLGLPIANSDAISLFDTEDSPNTFTIQGGVMFPRGNDYLFLVESGYKNIPSDIKDAASIMLDDLKCGRIDYHKRYITSYSTDQYRIQIDKSSLNGTGNLLVDKILDKYVTDVKKPRIL